MLIEGGVSPDRTPKKEELSPYYEWISATLQGTTEQLAHIPEERLDFQGLDVAMFKYREIEGEDRDEFIRGLGQVIERSDQTPKLAADAVQLARGLKIRGLEPAVQKLAKTEATTFEPLATGILRYLRDAPSYP